MKEEIILDIQAYMKFLEEAGYSVSLSFGERPFLAFATELMQYDIHPHALCNYLKQHPQTEGRCIHNKTVLKKMRLKKPCYSCCFGGVEEFLVPLHEEGRFLCYIHVSGYRGILERSARNRAQLENRCGRLFSELYEELSDAPPTMEQVLSFVRPLSYMIRELYRLYQESRKNADAETPTRQLYIKALQYIHENYPAPITCRSLSEELRYSESYVRHIFQKEGRTSVQAKINEVRLNNAKRLLRSTTMSVTEIAFSVGFTDSNYFSSFFKKREGLTPREYRKSTGVKGNL